MLVDLHNHTPLCNHAKGEPIEFVQKAIEHNISVFGFSDHAPMNFDEAYRMGFDEMDKYEKTVLELKSEYKNQINIKLETGNIATDDLMNTIISALNKYTIDLAKEQIRIAFAQAEKEVKDLHKRTSEGLTTAKLNGKQVGLIKGTKLTTKKSIEAKEIILKHSKDFNGNLEDTEVMLLAKCSRNSFYKYKRELKEISE